MFLGTDISTGITGVLTDISADITGVLVRTAGLALLGSSAWTLNLVEHSGGASGVVRYLDG